MRVALCLGRHHHRQPIFLNCITKQLTEPMADLEKQVTIAKGKGSASSSGSNNFVPEQRCPNCMKSRQLNNYHEDGTPASWNV